MRWVLMSQRLKLTVAYDGAPFAGWQSQSHKNSIQDQIEHAFKRISGTAIRVHGAGRTDAGVHALGQCAHVDVPDKGLPLARWPSALNALLPPAIRILRCQAVSPNFHARFSATGKIYRYRIWSAAILPPLEYGRAWHITAPLDFGVLKSAAGQFAGKHDFRAFAANRGQPANDTVRTIHSVKTRRRGDCITIEFEGNGFLYKMVRLMVGAIVLGATGKLPLPNIAQQLGSGHPDSARLVAPAEGLFLVRVRY